MTSKKPNNPDMIAFEVINAEIDRMMKRLAAKKFVCAVLRRG